MDVFKREFRLKNIWFGHTKPEAFYNAQWRWHPGIYITYRLIVACYSIGCLLAIEIWSDSATTLAYLTIWTYTILTLYQFSSFLVCIYCLTCGRGNVQTPSENDALVNANKFNGKEAVVAVRNLGYVEEDTNMYTANGNMSKVSNGCTENTGNCNTNKSSTTDADSKSLTSWYMKLTWCLADIVYAFGIIVTVIYFGVLFRSIGVTKGFIHDLNMHAFNSVQILIDIVIVARPVRLLHLLYPLLYGICYLIFSVFYWLQDKQNNVLYPGVLDWNKPGQTVLFMALLALIGLPVLQLILYLLFRLRIFIFRKLYGTVYLD